VNLMLALAAAGLRESLRNRVTVVVGVFAGVMLLSTTLMLNLTLFSLDRVITDFGLSVMSLLLAGLAIFLSSGLISKEIERRTIFLVVSRPVSRSQFIVGRFFGNLVTLFTLLLMMTALFVSQLLFFEVPMTGAQAASVLGLALEVTLLTAVGMLCSVLSSQLLSALTCVGVYLLGHLTNDLYALAQRSPSEVLRTAGKIAYYVLPNLSRTNYRGLAAFESPVDWTDVASTAGYIGAYTVIVLQLTSLAFQRRDFK
jgi:Cu-processing system permease protein